jgi:Golgi nucleoside diphosphatase
LGIEFAFSKMELWRNATPQKISRDSSELDSKLRWSLTVPGISSISNKTKEILKCYLKGKWLMQFRFVMEYFKKQKIRTKQLLSKATIKRMSVK